MSATVIIPVISGAPNLFVFGFATELEQPEGTGFIELVMQVNDDGTSSIMWMNGITTIEPNMPDVKLVEFLDLENQLTGAITVIDVAWSA